jgi:NAD kinase
MGAVLSAQTIRRATHAVAHSDLTAAVKTQATKEIRARGVSFVPPTGSSAHSLAVLGKTMTSSISDGARPALLFAATLALMGALVALLIPDTSSLLAHGPPVIIDLDDGAAPKDMTAMLVPTPEEL